MKRPALIWWALFVIALVAGEGLGFLLRLQGLVTFGYVVAWVGRLFTAGWVFWGLYRWRETPVVRKVALVVIASILAALWAGVMHTAGSRGGLIATAGIYAMGLAFFLGLQGLRAVLAGGHPVLGVARTLVDEAVRMKLPLVFIIALVLFVPVLPISLDAADPLKYRIQTFLTWAMMAVGGLLSLMTVFLAVGTVTGEIGQRQIFLTLTKPVARWQYLLGKWLGIVSLNALLVLICGGAIYVMTMMLAQQPALDLADQRAVREQVLVAREAIAPRPPSDVNFSQLFERRIEQLRYNDPETYGRPGDPIAQLDEQVIDQVQSTILGEWFSIGPRQSKTYAFNGIRLDEGVQTLQLRLKPKLGSSTPDDLVRLQMEANGRNLPVPPLSDDGSHVIPIPASLVRDGQLALALTNPALPGDGGEAVVQPTISFNQQDGLQLLYRAGAFEPNLGRSLVILWLRLSFLAMLGLAAGSLLSFPVACLAVLLVYFAAAGSSFVAESLEGYARLPKDDLPLWDQVVGVPQLIVAHLGAGEFGKAIKVVIRLIGELFLLLVPRFGAYDPVTELQDGRIVPMSMLGQAFLNIGLLWTGAAGVLAYLLFRRRELARVQV
jgi:hypothetical protein